jgi:glutamate/tyrosine decarboxylase-like PLP-dependent enzyme
MEALGHCDSITVDPHKMGYLPYGAGAFVCRDERAMALLVEDADYVFAGDEDGDDYFTRFRKLGRYIPEGSKSGAAAAAVYVTHQVLPLDHENFGRIPGETIRSTGVFVERAARFARELADTVTVLIPFAPDSNIVCLALNPAGNTSLAGANAFMRTLYEQLRCDPAQAVQAREFYGSMTTLRPEAMGAAEARRAFAALGLDVSRATDGTDDDRLVILRHTLMNPFIDDTANGIHYIDRYFEFLERRVRALLAPAAARPPGSSTLAA